MIRQLLLAFLVSLGTISAQAGVAEKVARDKVAGIDLVTCKTEVENVVTFVGSLPAGDTFAPPNNLAIPTLVGGMLEQGTQTEDKFAIARQLESIGARIDFDVQGVMLEFDGKCLRKDLPRVIALLAEELRTPAFAADEFEKLKKQLAGDLQRALESTEHRANEAFFETIFPPGHPNHQPPTKEFITAIESAKLEDVKKFHAEYYGPAQATLIAVGDIDPAALKAEVAKSFAGWEGGKTVPRVPAAPAPHAQKRVIEMADKPNVTVIIGQATGLRYRDPDALALRVGDAALGSGFTGRLMASVRDKEGLTYGIRSSVVNDSLTDGAWEISANFAPELLAQGMASTKSELDQWYAHGITAAELERVKTNLVGTYKVGLTTTEGMASALLNAFERGYDEHWLDEYPQRIAALSLESVNAAIKKYLRPEQMTVIEAGSVPIKSGRP
ncbi:MAG: M16 family metallopeptidase [Chthoniobacterales bacterium]